MGVSIRVHNSVLIKAITLLLTLLRIDKYVINWEK